MRADVVLQPNHLAGLRALATAVSTPGSGERGAYLTSRQIAARFGPGASALGVVKSAISSAGLTLAGESDHFTLRVEGSAGAMERAFGTSIDRYRLSSGRLVFANTGPARLPAQAAAHVLTVVGLSDVAHFRPSDAGGPRMAPNDRASGVQPASATPVACKAALRKNTGAYNADQLAQAYGIKRLWSDGDLGAGSTIGIYELESNSPADISAYETCYGIHPSITYTHIDGGSGSGAGSGEAALDIEDVAGLAPASNIVVYQAPNNSTGPFDAIRYIVDHPTASVVTTSWGECEQFLGYGASGIDSAAAAESTYFEIAAAEGQTWVSAAGDNGTTDCDPTSGPLEKALTVDDPGSQPFVTSIGGTSLHISSTGAITEKAWNNSYGASGGGISQVWPMPAYQSTAPTGLHVTSTYSSAAPCAASSGLCRQVPDVSADADPAIGYAIYWRGSWGAIGGTSAAAPLWAALLGLTEASGSCGGRPLGLVNPSLYRLAAGSWYGADFRDVTSGNNDYVPSGRRDGRYPAGPGYDMATGLGSPLAAQAGGALVGGLCSLASSVRPGVTSIKPASGPAGTKVTISGYGLKGVSAVYFGSVPAAFFSYVDATASSPPHVVATAPVGSGAVDVEVQVGTRRSAAVAGDLFTYPT